MTYFLLYAFPEWPMCLFHNLLINAKRVLYLAGLAAV